MKLLIKLTVWFLLLPGFKGAGQTKSVLIQKTEESKTTFIIANAVNDLNGFRELVKDANCLKKYGNVQINIGAVADKAFYEVPEGGNPWSEYASNFANLYKFYPVEKIAPFVPAKFIEANRQLLLTKANILHENRMDAAFFANEPGIIPSAFFEAHPHLRGPRVDHPRRSNVAFFSPCLSVKEMQDMYANMMAELLKHAPEIKTFLFKSNDAGSGNCWSDWLYPGSNGPAHCKNETTGERIEHLLSAIQQGATLTGSKLDLYLSERASNFTEKEKADIQKRLPKDCYFASTPEHVLTSIGSNISFFYPVKGIFNVYSFLNGIRKIDTSKKQYLFIDVSANYSRGSQSAVVNELVFQLLADRFEGDRDNKSVLQTLHEYCVDWVGEKNADSLSEAFLELDKIFEFRNSYLGNLKSIYWNVSSRIVTRPLVAAPQRLSKKEEAYFLPYVFNVSEDEARMDYLDFHGGRWTTSPDLVKIYVEKLKQVYTKLEAIDSSVPKNDFIEKMATALRIHASLIRSIGNFTEAQFIRDKNANKLNGPVHRPDKEPTWEGDLDLQRFNTVMRDELDNTVELVSILQNGGMDVICHANDKAHEDCFLLGPDLIEQLKKKQKIMLDHWRDIEDYMTIPFK